MQKLKYRYKYKYKLTWGEVQKLNFHTAKHTQWRNASKPSVRRLWIQQLLNKIEQSDPVDQYSIVYG